MKLQQQGFSLLELLIALSIMSILTMLVMPSYTQHIVHEHRIEAEIALEQLAAKLEQYKTLNNTYQGATLITLGVPSSTDQNTYQCIISNASSSEFLITAVASAAQTKKDPLCATLTLNSQGEKGITGSGKVTDCW